MPTFEIGERGERGENDPEDVMLVLGLTNRGGEELLGVTPG